MDVHGMKQWTCTHAEMNGELEMLMYAHEHGCPYLWDGDVCSLAAEQGDLEMLNMFMNMTVHGRY
jgi:hypothetical protein